MSANSSRSFLVRLLCLGLTLVPAIGNSTAIELSFSEAKSPIISGPCDQIGDEVSFLKSLRQRWNLPACEVSVESQDGICKAQIDRCLPENLKAMQGKSFSSYGPNCYNTALKTIGVYPFHRFVSEPEMAALLKTPACTQVTQPIPGDIGVFHKDGYASLHAFVYISPGLVFEKFGFDDNERVYPMTLNLRAYTDYAWEAPPECRRWAGKNFKACSYKTYYYRCNGKLPQNDFSKAIRAIEKVVGDALNTGLETKERSELQEKLNALDKKLGVAAGSLDSQLAPLYKEQIKSLQDQLKTIISKQDLK